MTDSIDFNNLNGEFDEFSILELQSLMEEGKLSSVEIVNYYLDRIEKIDKNGPALNSVLEINPDAVEIASQMDKNRSRLKNFGNFGDGGSVFESPLLGIPVLIKGNIDTADKMATTAGSLAMAGNIAEKDAEIVANLRKAGAVILGKTNLSEWANFRSNNSSSGWSSLGGQTKNPYILDRNPCGSSSGSGVAVSANLCVAAIGTETDGSIICPSSSNGIVGIKPTIGLVSQKGIIPISHSQDTAGPMTRTVKDALMLLNIIADNPITVDNSFLDNIDRMELTNTRVGVIKNYFGINPDVDKKITQAIALMSNAGASTIDIDIESSGKFDDAEYEVLLYEFKAGLNRYLSGCSLKSSVKSLSDLIEYNNINTNKIMPWFKQDILELANKKGPLTDRKYRHALSKSKKLSGPKGIAVVMDKHNLDVLAAPSGGPAWKTDWINGDHYSLGSSSYAAVSGYPNITVPAGFVHGLPIGISFFGKAYSDIKIIKIAAVYEKISTNRKIPMYRPS
jgi:amidase